MSSVDDQSGYYNEHMRKTFSTQEGGLELEEESSGWLVGVLDGVAVLDLNGTEILENCLS
jgi:hypothetical protein